MNHRKLRYLALCVGSLLVGLLVTFYFLSADADSKTHSEQGRAEKQSPEKTKENSRTEGDTPKLRKAQTRPEPISEPPSQAEVIAEDLKRSVIYKIDIREVAKSDSVAWESLGLRESSNGKKLKAEEIVLEAGTLSLSFVCRNDRSYAFNSKIEGIFFEWQNDDWQIRAGVTAIERKCRAYSAGSIEVHLSGFEDELLEDSPYVELRFRPVLGDQIAEAERNEGGLIEIPNIKLTYLARDSAGTFGLGLNERVLGPFTFPPEASSALIRLAVLLEGFRPGVVEFPAPPVGKVGVVPVELKAYPPTLEYRAKVRVQNSTGEPIAGATLHCLEEPLQTDEKGEATLVYESRSIPELEYEHKLAVVAAGYASKALPIMLKVNELPTVIVELEQSESTLIGSVVYLGSGLPVPNVEVYLDEEGERAMPRPTQRTDDQGRYRFENLSGAKVNLRLETDQGRLLKPTFSWVPREGETKARHYVVALPRVRVINDLPEELRIEITPIETSVERIAADAEAAGMHKRWRSVAHDWQVASIDQDIYWNAPNHMFSLASGAQKECSHFEGSYELFAYHANGETRRLAFKIDSNAEHQEIRLSEAALAELHSVNVKVRIDGELIPAACALVLPGHLDGVAIARTRGYFQELSHAAKSLFRFSLFAEANKLHDIRNDAGKLERLLARMYKMQGGRAPGTLRVRIVGQHGNADRVFAPEGKVTIVHPIYGVYYEEVSQSGDLVLDYDKLSIPVEIAPEISGEVKHITLSSEPSSTASMNSIVYLRALRRSADHWRIGPPPSGPVSVRVGFPMARMEMHHARGSEWMEGGKTYDLRSLSSNLAKFVIHPPE